MPRRRPRPGHRAVRRQHRPARGGRAARRRPDPLRRQGRPQGGRQRPRSADSTRLLGLAATDQARIDRVLCEIDGTPNKSRAGANAILGVSLAVAHAAAASKGMPLWRYLDADGLARLPLPMVNLISGGLHAGGNLDFQDFLLLPIGARTYSEALEMTVAVYRSLTRRADAARLRGRAGRRRGRLRPAPARQRAGRRADPGSDHGRRPDAGQGRGPGPGRGQHALLPRRPLSPARATAAPP